MAVTCFYIISGFYMAMVISNNYRSADTWPWRFYASRALRLFPTYWAVLLLAVVTTLAIQGPAWLLNLNHSSNPVSWLLVVASNASIWGLDVVNFVAKAQLTNHTLIRLVGPAWTLAIELQFYAVAPFVVTRSLRVCLAVLAAALLVHFSLFHVQAGLRWYLAPSAWCYFFLGAVSYRLMRRFKELAHLRAVALGGLLVLIPLAFAARIWITEDVDQPLVWLFVLVFAAVVPFLFYATASNAPDNSLGALSYPMYLVHSPLLVVFAAIFAGNDNEIYKLGFWPCALIFVTIIAVSLVVHFGIEEPIDKVRHRLRRQATSRTSVTTQATARA
jgi:peptidoglycan/LPS O-acetylase OafA/YrhL